MVRARPRITGRDLARHIHMDETSLSKKLNGQRPWALVEMIAVADCLRVDLRDLLGGMWDQPAPALRNRDLQAGGVQPTRRKVDAKGLAPVIPLRPPLAIAV